MEITALESKDVERFVDELWLPAQEDLAAGSPFTLKSDIREAGIDHRRDRLTNDETVTYLASGNADRDERLLGFLTAEVQTPPPIFESDRECHINELYVRPSNRSRGVATELLAVVESWAADHGCERLDLNVTVANEIATAFYESAGFEIVRYNMKRPVEPVKS